MSSYLNLSLANPIKFTEFTDTNENHFDLRWTKDQRLPNAVKAYYKQKWYRSLTTPIQIESTIPPTTVKIVDPFGAVVKTINWDTIFVGTNYNIYQFIFDISDIAAGTYFIRFDVTKLSFDRKIVSEPIMSADSFGSIPMLVFQYWNSFNDFDIAWTLLPDTRMIFCCEGCIPANQMLPKRNATSYANQDNRVKVLSAVPYRLHQLYVGGTKLDIGVAPYVLDIVNRIMDHDSVYINEKAFVANVSAEWKKTDILDYPLVTGALDICEAGNRGGLNFSDSTPIAPGIVVGYDLDTAIFGAGTVVPILEVQENS